MDNTIDVVEALILVSMYPVYLYISIKFYDDEAEHFEREKRQDLRYYFKLFLQYISCKNNI
jgi:hypothetical protein